MACFSGVCKRVAQLCSSGSRGSGLLSSEEPGTPHRKSHPIGNAGKISAFYKVDPKKIGSGSYGSVSKATHKPTGSVRAVKTIAKAVAGKSKKGLERLMSEIDIMAMMDHPSIVKLYETFEDHHNLYLVMELCSGGELFDRIVEAGHFAETEAAVVMRQMISAVNYMHSVGVCHRDLKPENFLFLSRTDPIPNNLLKLIDFGLSATIQKGKYFSTKAGTPYYVAPQVLDGRYDQSCDIWSCGVIMFVLLCGYPPFYAETDDEVLKLVKKGVYTFNKADWSCVSNDAKDLISHVLKMSPSGRYTASQALKHVWITKKAPRAQKVTSKSLVNNLRGFRSTNKFKKVALQVIAGQLSEDRIKSLRESFMAMDKNQDGTLSFTEIKEGLTQVNSFPPDLQQVFKDIDVDNSGVIDYTEFLAATLDARLYLQEDVCWSAFCVFDKNGDGRISLEELKSVLKSGDLEGLIGKQTVEEVMAEVDSDGNGMIDFQEFMQMMRKTTV
eukprot:CAMPEP_0179042224 /NCGR_PEP_ID=MMETSP0796-20121207/16556_1 /TAXON_ID=73915 /ORGANISM="Pyrodinium bahamense, Strain pbaha01" /LENGTH=497 /DNA_ID=CAMNT_0020738601 /DNA_START=34 /DNA_END=1527 /DNA_ORIENTATION=+